MSHGSTHHDIRSQSHLSHHHAFLSPWCKYSIFWCPMNQAVFGLAVPRLARATEGCLSVRSGSCRCCCSEQHHLRFLREALPADHRRKLVFIHIMLGRRPLTISLG